MNETYCGKSCELCGVRTEMDCPGCAAVQGECDLARCCQEKGHTTCASCTHNIQCEQYQGRDHAPQTRLEKKEAELAHQQNLKKRGVFLSRQMRTLFWVMICINVVSLVGEWASNSGVVGKSLEIIFQAIYALTLMQMATECGAYRKAGMLQLVSVFMDIPVMFHQGEISATLLSMISAVLCMVSGYFEFMSHSTVLRDVDEAQSQKWRKLWYWLIGFQCATVLGILLTIVYIGVVMIMVGAIGVLVVSIFEMVYLYRSAQIFRNLAVE